LYDSLNVGSSFPELDGIPLGFVRNLLLARDLKINIRKRAIANFFEWDRLHQAAGGQSQALGKLDDKLYTSLIISPLSKVPVCTRSRARALLNGSPP
jgi:hypothetical protein